MHGDDCSCAARDGTGDGVGIGPEPVRFAIHQDRLRSGVMHRFDVGGECVGVDDHLITGGDTEADHGEQQSVGAGGDP